MSQSRLTVKIDSREKVKSGTKDEYDRPSTEKAAHRFVNFRARDA
jgi:hypothetical protein